MQALYQRHVQRSQRAATGEETAEMTDHGNEASEYDAQGEDSSNPNRASSLRTDLKDKLSEMKRLIDQQRQMHKDIATINT